MQTKLENNHRKLCDEKSQAFFGETALFFVLYCIFPPQLDIQITQKFQKMSL